MSLANKILVLSTGEAIPAAIRAALRDDVSARIEEVEGTLEGLNGTAYAMLQRHDLMIFEIDPDDAGQLAAVAALNERRGQGKALIAMTDGDVSLSKARQLKALGIDEVLPMGISEAELRSSIASTLKPKTPMAGGGGHDEGAVICFAQARGGVGSTTVAVNVAHALAKRKRGGRRSRLNKVVLLDFDLQFGTANVLLDIEDQGGFMKLIESHDVPDISYMRSIIQHHPSGLDILVAPVTVAPLNALRPTVVSAMIEALQEEYDFVIIDLPRALVDWVEPVLDRCARMFIVTDTSVPAIRHSRRLLDFFREANIGMPIDLIVNHETKPLLPARHIREAEQAVGKKIAHWLPHNTKAARRSADYGVPVVAHASRSDLARSMQRLAAKIETTQPSVAVNIAE